MEGGENILDAIIYEEDDVEMVDVEEGELVEEEKDHHRNGVAATQDHNLIHEAENNRNDINQKPKALSKNRKRKNKRKRKALGGSDAPINIDRFVIETCRRLKEKKSYMVYTALGCLGVSALSDIVKEVDAIQSCGGQQTADGKRFRTGGGVLWNIIKVREPNAYKEIMKKAREFEKQFRQPSFKQPSMQKEEDSSQVVPCPSSSAHQGNVSDNPTCASQLQDQDKPPGSEKKRVPVRDRLRIPVSYDDDLLGATVENDVTLP